MFAFFSYLLSYLVCSVKKKVTSNDVNFDMKTNTLKCEVKVLLCGSSSRLLCGTL